MTIRPVRQFSLAAVGGLAVCALTVGAGATRQAVSADIVLLNGRIITVDANDRLAQGVAIGGGKIIAVGSNAEIQSHIGSSTERIDLGGRAVTPGLLDAHAHFHSGGVQRLFVLTWAPHGEEHRGRQLAARRAACLVREQGARPSVRTLGDAT